jgi:hypothetical protein
MIVKPLRFFLIAFMVPFPLHSSSIEPNVLNFPCDNAVLRPFLDIAKNYFGNFQHVFN